MINLAYLVLQTIVNKEQSGGYVSPAQYNDLAVLVQEEIFRSYFEDINRDQNKQNRGFSGLNYANLVDNQLQRIEPFLKTVTLSTPYALPSDLYMLDTDGIITSITEKVVDKVPRQSRGYISNSAGAATVTFPQYYVQGNNIVILPSTYADDIDISYIKVPSEPEWAYTVIGNGDSMYNDVASTDFELHPSEFSNIVLRMLSYMGINLREGQVVQVAESLKSQMTNKDEG